MIDTQRLAAGLEGRRWFGGGGRTIAGLEILDEATIDDGPPGLVLALASVSFASGDPVLYSLPLLVEDDGGSRDAFEDVDSLRVIGDLMAHGHSVKGNHGTFLFGGPGLDPMAPPGHESARAIEVEQSNSSVVFDDAVILKLFRRVEPGPNPDLEINRLLTNEGFQFIPPHVGEISYDGEIDGDEVTIDIGIAQRFVHHATEGWSLLLDHVRALYESAHPDDNGDDLPLLVEERAAESLSLLSELGDATAALHVLLSREEMEPEFVPDPVEEYDLMVWADRIESALRTALRSDIYGTGRIEEEAAACAERLRHLDAGKLGSKIRIHADYHLGQVLRAPREWLIIDFEGEPLRSLESRRAKQSPLRDVAGMLRSFSYAAISVLMERGGPDEGDWPRLEPWADAWEEAARESFLSSYLATSHEGRFLPEDRDELAVLLDGFEIDKALYELAYERAHRPDWVRIPLRGIVKVCRRGENR